MAAGGDDGEANDCVAAVAVVVAGGDAGGEWRGHRRW